jgi:chromosome partitioning protein
MRTVAIVNQKGGCGKTTTTVNLAGCLAADGQRVLVVDMDPQAHATLALGVDPEAVEENIYEVLAEDDAGDALEAILVKPHERIDLAPSGIVLSALEQKLAAERSDARTQRLAAALLPLSDRYDFVLIDCPPNVGLLTFNALRAAQEVIVPLETSFFAIHGVKKVLETITLLSERISHDVQVRILPTLYDGRTRYARETLAEIRETFGDLCFDTVVRQNVKLREAARRGRPINQIARSANGSIDYGALAVELEATPPEERPVAPSQAADRESPEREVVIQYRDVGANDVRIAGDFNGWIPDKDVRSVIQSEGQSRVWTKILRLPPGTYQYRYVVDGQWQQDPENPNSVDGPVGNRNSVLVVS